MSDRRAELLDTDSTHPYTPETHVMRHTRPSMWCYACAWLGMVAAAVLLVVAAIRGSTLLALSSILCGLGMYCWLYIIVGDDLAHAQRQQRPDDHTRGTR